MRNGRSQISFFVSPTAVCHPHQLIRSSFINAKRQIRRALKTQIYDWKKEVLLFGPTDFRPGHKKWGVPWPEEKQHRKVNAFRIGTNFDHVSVAETVAQNCALQGITMGRKRFAIRIRFGHAAPAAQTRNEVDDGAPKQGEGDQKAENDQNGGDGFVIHEGKDSVITAVCKPIFLTKVKYTWYPQRSQT